jgi:hypothetical protein
MHPERTDAQLSKINLTFKSKNLTGSSITVFFGTEAWWRYFVVFDVSKKLALPLY